MMQRIRRRVYGALAVGACAAILAPTSAFAQSPSPSGETSVFANMPGVVYLLIPLAIVGAIYLSRELGRTAGDDSDGPERRQGAVSRTLARRKETH